MGSSEGERRARREFAERYSSSPTHLLLEIERAALGAAWGANGFTTRAEADRLAAHLSLGPDDHLLDVGSGLGWPGLYLSKETGCRVTLTDLPAEGLREAVRRARVEKLPLAGAVVASAKELPFASDTFDAVTHTDVLC